MDETEKTLWNTRANDLTVGDAVKLNLVSLGVMVGGVVVVVGASVAVEKFKQVRQNRKDKKSE